MTTKGTPIVGLVNAMLRRTFGLAATLALLGACGDAAAPREVVVYTAVDQVYAEPILKSYEQKTGVRVKAIYDVEAAKTTGLVTRLEAEKARPQADVFWSGEFAQTIRLATRGVLAAYRSPSAADLPAGFRDADDRWAGMGGRARVFIVNTRKLLPADYPSTLDDLLSPRWPAASVGIASPLFGTNATHAAALYAQRGAGSARTFYQAVQARGVRVVDGNSVVKDLVASGQLAWGLTDTDDVLEAMQRGAPVKAIAPDQGGAGTLVIPGTVALVAGAPHREQGQALVDFLLSANTEAALIRVGGCQTSLRIGAGPGHEKTGNATGLQGIKALAVGLNDVQAQLPTAMRDLREIFVR